MNRNQRVAAALAGLVVLVFAAWWMFGRAPASSGEIRIETTEAANGSVRRIVAASGAVRALVTVEVGSQLSGQIAELSVDYNDRVEADQIIARLDPQTYETRVREAEAARATGRATVALQRASLERVRANTASAQLDYDRMVTLHGRGNASQAALDTAQTSLDAAMAELNVGQAQIANAEAVLQQREATLEGARIDLERTIIRSPISGVVIDRAVDQGQTVAASLSAPTLFTIAQDLSQVQIDAQVDEADIGQIAEGQSVRFTVDAYTGLELTGAVEQIRLAPTTLGNVVTYTVVISAANPGQRLLPGMTANMDIITGEREDVLTVENAALRFRPSPALAGRSVPLVEGGQSGGPRRGGPGGGQGSGGRGPGGMLERLTTELELTPDQQDQVQAAFRGVMVQARSVAEHGGQPDRSAMQSAITTALQGILSEDQMRRYRTLQAEARDVRQATLWVETADGQLEERPVRIGISDSQNTEVIGGRLELGEQVVTRAREVRE
jgi:HlyD family secretion protein